MVTILIVDDNATFRMQAARLCESEGFNTVTAATLAELSVVLMSSKPDLALLDIELPQIPGHRLGALIRARHQIPILLVSALTEDRLRRLFEASDADGWICKPLTRDKLIAAVTRFVMKKPERPSGATTPEVRATERGEGPRLLLVEDEHLIAARIESALASTFSVTSVSEGGAAIEHLLHDRYDCVLLDLTLPHLSGFDVLRHLVLHRPELLRRTVIMTAATDESLQFIDSDAVAGILRKPFDLGAMVALVGGIVQH
jgi:DNA-binding response OmpR family regulator